MRLTIMFLCIASLTFALALPTWKQVTKTPVSLSSSLRVGASKTLTFGEQALLHGGAPLSRRGDEEFDPDCQFPEYAESYPAICASQKSETVMPIDPYLSVKTFLTHPWEGIKNIFWEPRPTAISRNGEDSGYDVLVPPTSGVSFSGQNPV